MKSRTKVYKQKLMTILNKITFLMYGISLFFIDKLLTLL